MKIFSVYGQDNDTYFFSGRNDLARCKICGHLLDKWSENLGKVEITKKKLDVSYSYDGILVVSKRFKKTYDLEGFLGLKFREISEEFYTVIPEIILEFDFEKRKTRFTDKCDSCGFYGSISGADPVILKNGQIISEAGFVRTDIEFGFMDEQAPVILCGEKAGMVLKKEKLRGLDLILQK